MGGCMITWPWKKWLCVVSWKRHLIASIQHLPPLANVKCMLILNWRTESSHRGQPLGRVSQLCADVVLSHWDFRELLSATKPSLSWLRPTIDWSSLLQVLFGVLEHLCYIWIPPSLKFKVGHVLSLPLRLFIWEEWWTVSLHLSKSGLCWIL